MICPRVPDSLGSIQLPYFLLVIVFCELKSDNPFACQGFYVFCEVEIFSFFSEV